MNQLPGALDDFTNPGTWLAVLDGGDLAVCQRAYGANGYDVLLARYGALDGTPGLVGALRRSHPRRRQPAAAWSATPPATCW